MRTMLQSRPDFSKVTYRMIAKWQESSAYGSERKANNPGAHFFGLSDVDIEKQFKLTKQHAVEKAQKNLNNEIKRLVQASHGKK